MGSSLKFRGGVSSLCRFRGDKERQGIFRSPPSSKPSGSHNPHPNRITPPIELTDRIINFCYNDKTRLSNCALTHSSWLAANRFHLFYVSPMRPVSSAIANVCRPCPCIRPCAYPRDKRMALSRCPGSAHCHPREIVVRPPRSPKRRLVIHILISSVSVPAT